MLTISSLTTQEKISLEKHIHKIGFKPFIELKSDVYIFSIKYNLISLSVNSLLSYIILYKRKLKAISNTSKKLAHSLRTIPADEFSDYNNYIQSKIINDCQTRRLSKMPFGQLNSCSCAYYSNIFNRNRVPLSWTCSVHKVQSLSVDEQSQNLNPSPSLPKGIIGAVTI